MKAYQLVARAGVVVGVRRRADGVGIPPDPSNGDYAAFLRWQAEGNAPDAADPDGAPPADDPDEVTVRRLARALIRKGVISLNDLLNERKD